MKKQKQTKTVKAVARKKTSKSRGFKALHFAFPRKKRSLHRRIALHPLNILAMLCVGVLLCSFTLNAVADSYSVTGVVPAAPLTGGAVITSPVNGYQTGTQAIVVSGTCPANSYVDLLDNGIFAGTDTCTNGAFSVGLDLSPGTNNLQAQAYNITNAPGPISPTVTVTYNPPPPPPSSTPPTSTATSPSVATPVLLTVTRVDRTVLYIQGETPPISSKPTMTGTAPAYSKIVIHVSSSSSTCVTYATVVGFWSCSFSSPLPSGLRTVYVSAVTPTGKVLTHPAFNVYVTGNTPASGSPNTTFRLVSSYSYTVHNVGQPVSYSVRIIGGEAPYVITVLWGDGSNSTIVRQNTDAFTISHSYGWFDASTGSRTVKVQGVDGIGESSTLQLIALLRNPEYHNAIAAITKSTGLWGFFNVIRPWLWILWPGYIIVILLVLSFWLGEREEREKMKAKRRFAFSGNNRQAHSHR